ncbi:hypothetical protein PIB30_042406 [Stylosanthes scabra]|uniref:Uncharacterized protein n=1 Tax=Stylosanthes scabra TaxID=79078 RepID=A0ABU6YCJ8_9FABA|nr:hypothetical protein [Stylosanthes scabra]
MARARARGQMGAQKCVLMGSRGRAVRRARARGPCSSWSESSKREGVDPPRPSCGRTAVRARQERGANAPHTCVASGECHYAHRVDAPRPSCGRARRAGVPIRWCERAVASDCGSWQSQIMRLRHQEGAAAPLPLLEELYHGGVSPT